MMRVLWFLRSGMIAGRMIDLANSQVELSDEISSFLEMIRREAQLGGAT